MYPFSHTSLRLLLAVAAASGAVACASAPTPPPVAVTPPSHAFQMASSPGVAEQQGTDDVVFVEQSHKDPATHDDAVPATSLHAESGTARPASTPKP